MKNMANFRQINKKRAFTLLELVISLCVIGMAASLVLWNLKGFLERHRFNDSAEKLASEMGKLKKLALYYQVEMEMDLISSPKGIFYKVSSDEPLAFLSPAYQPLPCIERISFQGRPSNGLHFVFSRDGQIYPSAVLGLHEKSGQTSYMMDLSKEIKLKRSVSLLLKETN